jgi:predicted RNA polymerase sigma factor
MAQRISRAKKTLAGQSFAQPADVAVVLRVVYLIFNEGYAGRVDLAAEAIRLTRLLALESDEPEVAGLLALMLLHHARRAARTVDTGAVVPLDRQDRGMWDSTEIAEGVSILQAALAKDRRGEYQIQAAIAALHDDARTAAETDWPQILAWYDELVALTDNPAAAMSRAVAVGEVDGPRTTGDRRSRRAVARPPPARRRPRPPSRAGRPPRHCGRALRARRGKRA